MSKSHRAISELADCRCPAIARADHHIELLRSTLKNARNVLRDGGYLYAKEIDKVLETSP